MSTTVTATIGQVPQHGERILLRTPFELKDVVKRVPGRQWAKEKKVWHVPATPAGAENVRAIFDEVNATLQVDVGFLRLAAQAEAQHSALANKRRDDLPEFPGKVCQCETPRPGDVEQDQNPYMCLGCHRPLGSMMHQRQAYWFAHPRDAAALLMDMGTGKSKTAIGLLDGWNIDVAIVLAPIKAVRVWPREFHGGDVKNFEGHSERPWIVENGRRIPNRASRGKYLKNPGIKRRVEECETQLRHAAQHNAPCALVWNYEAAWQQPVRGFLLEIRKLAEQAYGRPVRIGFIADESHKIKAPNGKWSKFAHELSKRADKRLILTGTPNPHSEPDLYAQYRCLDTGVFGTNYSAFLHRFFEMGGFEGREVQGFKDDTTEAEFVRLMSQMSFICDSDDVLDLPPATDLPTLTAPITGESAKHYASMESDFLTILEHEHGESGEDGEPVVAGNALVQLLRLAQITSGHLPVERDGEKHRIKIGDDKAKLLADALDDLPAGEKVAIFGRFHHDMAVIQAEVESRGLRYGEVSGRKGITDGLNDDAKWNEDCDVVGVQLQAGGVGVDLTACRYAIYYALDFNLGDFKQSRKRVHRPGQNRETFFIFLALENTVDETIATALRNRDTVLTALKDAAKNYEVAA